MGSFDKDSISRLAVAFLENDPELVKLGEGALVVIEERLRSYKLHIICSEEIRESPSQQAALLTAINVAKRCFRGGVYITMPEKVVSRIRWPKKELINDIVEDIGGTIVKTSDSSGCKVLVIGTDSERSAWRLQVNNWSAVCFPPGLPSAKLSGAQDFPLGGIAGAAIAVGSMFLRTSEFDFSIGSEPIGLSLWRPDLRWNDPAAQAPNPETFPTKLWLLGLGHLGQAYSWTIGMFPFAKPEEVCIKLQDDQRLVKGNLDSGMLCELGDVSEYKTRVVSKWLEARKIQTRIVERQYDSSYYRQADDPELLISGVDKLNVRKMLKVDEFKLALDCGLGGGLNFDMIRFNAFPNIGVSPSKLWENAKELPANPNLKEWSQKVTGCGYTVGIASAFTGCLSACISLSEILRSYHQGPKLSHLYLSIREMMNTDCGVVGYYATETFSGATPF